MKTINEWVQRHGISSQAMCDLMAIMGVDEPPIAAPCDLTSEAAAQQLIRIDASKQGNRLWRNNVGATMDESGRFIRFGLANDSKKMNSLIKSSDLIGITQRTITVGDVGKTFGLFTSIEVKKPGWMYAGTAREKAQLAWIKLIISLGGIAKFATGVDGVDDS